MKLSEQGWIVIPPGITQVPDIPVIPDSDKDMEKLLVSIAQEPLLGIAERYQKMYLSGRSGNQSKQKLIEYGLITEISIKTPKARIKLLELTDMGKEKLKEIGFDVSGSLRHGGVEHIYWVHQAKKKLENAGHKVHEEYPIGNGETIDLAIIGKNNKIAIEIETGKSDAIHNIRKCLDAGFEVVSLATNDQILGKIKSMLCIFTEDECRKIMAKIVKV